MLPLAVLVIAVLVPTTTARPGAIGALGLLVVFRTAIARAIVRGERPGCNCFGQLYSAPVGACTEAVWRGL